MEVSAPLVLVYCTDRSHEVGGSVLSLVEQQLQSENVQTVTQQQLDDKPEWRKHIRVVACLPNLTEGINQQLDQLPSLEMVVCMSSGTDYVDLDYCRSRGITVTTCQKEIAPVVADMTWTLLLAVTRDLIAASQGSPWTNGLLPHHVTGSTLGIVGMGYIGMSVAKRARGFDMKILYHNRNKRSNEQEESVGAIYCDTLDSLLPQCDIVVICCPLTPSTQHLFTHQQFKLMKKTAFLVNVGRGRVVNTDALVEALQTGEIRGAALDVTDPEPLPDGHPLLRMPNVLVTQHISSIVGGVFEIRANAGVENIFSVLKKH